MQYSFIIPVYNCKAYLPGCVESVLGVGVSDFEIILVDDGATDGSGELCDALAQEHSQVRAVHQPNGGASAARNRGLREATGEFILFIDADDSIDAELLCAILSDPRCADADMTIFGLSFDYYYHGRCYRTDPLYYELDAIMTKEQWGKAFSQLYLKNSLSPLWNKVFKRKLLGQLELNTDMFLYEDLEFVLRYMQRCETIFNVPRTVYHYRQAEDEGNAKRRLKRIDSIPVFLRPLETALAQLRQANPAVSKEAAHNMLLSLHLVLAREKISASDLSGIRRICREFASWGKERAMPLPDGSNNFHRRLLAGKVVSLLLADKKSALRHWVAVRIKALLKIWKR